MHRDDRAAPDFTGGREQQPDDTVERKLAQYAFVREERDREVRLLFRDLPAPEMALSFRAAGANLITLSGERASVPTSVSTDMDSAELLVLDETEQAAAKRKRKKAQQPKPQTGEVVLWYFFSLRDTVYTVVLAAPTGVMGSIAGIYPAAALSEQEIQARLQMVFS